MRKTRKIRMLLLALLSCLPSLLWAQTGQGFSGSGSGTESDPYLILEASDLDQVRNFLDQSGVYFKVMYNIDLTNWINDNNPSEGWQPIGVDAAKFKGVLDGNGKTISGIMINRPSTGFIGFFGALDGATVKNLTLKGSTVKGDVNTGTLSGYANNATISGINVQFSSVTGSERAGGLIGNAGAGKNTISSCTIATAVGGQYINHGGVVGINKGTLTLTSVKATGNVSGTESVGGLVGNSSTLTAKDCAYIGNVTGTNHGIGGLIGSGTTTTLTNCSSEGNVKGGSEVGGLIGSGTTSTLTSCPSTGDITGTGDNVGGAIGYCDKATLTKCSSVGDVTGANNVGGLVGHKIESVNRLVVGNSFALGNVKGTNDVGGLVGKMQNSFKPSINYTNDKKAATTYITKYTGSSYSLNSTTTYSGYTIVDIKYYMYHNGGNKYYDNNGSTCTYKYFLVSTSTKVEAELSNTSYDVDSRTAYSGRVIVAKFTYSSDNNGYYYNTNYGQSSSSGAYRYKYLTIPDIYGKEGNNQISNSYFNGEVTGTTDVGGIVGYAQTADIDKNYTSASVSGQVNVGGIVGLLDNGLYTSPGLTLNSTLTSNVAINSSVNASTSDAGRIYGKMGESHWTIGTLGSATTNKAMLTTQVSINGVAQTITEDLQQGNTVGAATLKKKATYQGIGWEMTNDWNIQETESFPYKSWQTAPPIILSGAVSGSTTITGKCVDNGTVYIEIGAKSYTATTSGNSWTVSVDALQAGTQIRVFAKSTTKAKSYSATSYVTYPGSGTAADPYQVYSVADLVGINGNYHYLLMNDLDLTSWINKNSPTTGWVPLGRNNSLASHFDGGNHTISGLWVNGSEAYTGLFANASNATIKNLILKIAEGKSVKGGNYTAALLGNATNTTIIKCVIEGKVEGGNYTGLLVGNANGGRIDSCSVSGQVKGTTLVGGVTGCSSANITYCTFNGDITTSTASAQAGGIAGKSTAIITKCVATSQLRATGASAYVGGIAGYTSAPITLSKSAGSIVASGESTYAGGITAYTTAAASITNCQSTADVEGTAYVAGVVAYNFAAVSNCYASGNLRCTGWGAGIVAYNDGASATTKNCVALCPKIELTESNGTAKRVLGGVKNGAPTPADTDNYAMKEMVLSQNGSAQTVSDNFLNGIAKENSELQTLVFYKNTLAWDITSLAAAKDKTWYIDNGSQYPVLFITMASAPVIITNPVTSITLSQTSLSLYVGGSATLVATIAPEDATMKNLTWTSSDESVATVNTSGVITALAPGSTVITALAEDGSEVKAECPVQVSSNPNNMYAGNVSGRANSALTLPVYLDNAEDMCAVQFDVKLPVGTEMDYTINSRTGKKTWSISLGTDRFEELDHSMSILEQADGSLRVVIKSDTNTPIWDTDASDNDIRTTKPLVNMVVRTAEGLAEGTYTVNLTNVTLAHYDNETGTTKYNANTLPSTISIVNACKIFVASENDAKGTVSITGSKYNASTQETDLNSDVTLTATPKPGYVFIAWTEGDTELSRGTMMTINVSTNRNIVANFALLGDAYEDDVVDVADVASEVSYILNNTVLEYRAMKIADVYADDMIDVADVASVVGIVLSPATVAKVAPRKAPKRWTAGIDMDGLFYTNGKATMAVSLGESANSLTALQFDVVLPEGFTFDKSAVSKAAELDHSVAYQLQQDGTMRVIMYSMSNESLATEDGRQLTLNLLYDDKTMAGIQTLELQNVKAFSTSMQAVYMDNMTYRVDASNATKIEAVGEDAQSDIYSLTGVRVAGHDKASKLSRGLYIVNGKKQIIK